MRSQLGWTAGGLAIGLVLLWFSLRGVSLDDALEVLRNASLGWCALVTLSGLAFLAVKSWRWSTILESSARVPFRTLHVAVYMGTAANLLIAHTGELLRSQFLWRREGVPRSTTLASIFVERTLDFVAVLALFAFIDATSDKVPRVLASAGTVCLVLVLIGVATGVLMMRPNAPLARLSGLTLSWLPDRLRAWVAEQLANARSGFSLLDHPGELAQVAVISLLQWGCILVAMWASAVAVGSTISMTGAIAVFVLAVVGLTLPSSPAQLGTTQLAFVIGLELERVSSDYALAASFVYTLFLVIPMMILGGALWALTEGMPRRSRKGPTPRSGMS